MGLLNNGINPEGTAFEQAELKAVYSDAQVEAMMFSIRATFEVNRITFIPLKGLVLKQFYPESSMRTCGDVDILVKEGQIEAATNVLVKECGYKVESYNFHDAKPRNPQGKGKQERFNHTVDSFLAEIAVKPPNDLYELNMLFDAWLSECYHTKTHSVIGTTPEIAFKIDSMPLRYCG